MDGKETDTVAIVSISFLLLLINLKSRMKVNTKGLFIWLNTSPGRPWADKRSKFLTMFIRDFHAGSERRGKSLDVINLQ